MNIDYVELYMNMVVYTKVNLLGLWKIAGESLHSNPNGQVVAYMFFCHAQSSVSLGTEVSWEVQ